MITILRGHELWKNPGTAQKMFQDRRKHFVDRLGWPLEVDAEGYEIDQYDGANPVYVIVSSPTNPHLASLRLLPMNKPNMIIQVFPELFAQVQSTIDTKSSIECTRMVCAEEADSTDVLKALAATAKLMAACGQESLFAVFYPAMLRIYRRLGAKPEVVATTNMGSQALHLGQWRFDLQTSDDLRASCQFKSSELVTSDAAISDLLVRTRLQESA